MICRHSQLGTASGRGRTHWIQSFTIGISRQINSRKIDHGYFQTGVPVYSIRTTPSSTQSEQTLFRLTEAMAASGMRALPSGPISGVTSISSQSMGAYPFGYVINTRQLVYHSRNAGKLTWGLKYPRSNTRWRIRIQLLPPIDVRVPLDPFDEPFESRTEASTYPSLREDFFHRRRNFGTNPISRN